MELTKSQVALLRDIAGSQTEEGYTEYEPASVDEDWKYSIDVLVHGNLIYNPYEGEEDDDRMKYCLSALGNIECALRLLLNNGYRRHRGEIVSPERFETLRERQERKDLIDSLENGLFFNQGDRMTLKIKEVGSFGFATEYGYTEIVTYSTEDGKMLKYMGSSAPSLEEGEFVEATFTVKHSEYKGQPETRIQRVKVLQHG